MGLAREKTRLLVLNSHYNLLKHADKIIVVQDGRIASDGTYADTLAQFSELQCSGDALDKLEQDVIDEHEDEEADKVNASAPPPTATPLKKDDHLVPDQHKVEGDGAGLISTDDRVKKRVSGQTYMSYFDETGFNGVLVVLTITTAYFAGQGMWVVVDWWQGHWAKEMESASTDSSYSELEYGLWYFGFIVVCALVTVGRGLLMMESCIRSSKSLHNELFRRVLSAPVNLYFDMTPVGRILNRFSNDLDQMDSVLPQHYQSLFQLGVLVGCLVVCVLASFWVGVSYLPMLVIFVITGVYFKQTSREVKRLEGVTHSPVFNLFGETLNGLHTIRVFKMQETFMELNKAAVDDNTSFYFTYWAAGRWLAIRLDWLSVLVIFVVTIYLVTSKGETDSVVAGISLTYSLMLTSMIQWVVRAVGLTDNAMTSVERLLYFRNIPVEKDRTDCVPINGAAWPARGAIRFDNLCLRYRPDLPLMLRGVSMDIQPREKVGICGRTGAGKSSLMIALFRICDFHSGSIFIDDIDIKNVRRHDLRRGLAITLKTRCSSAELCAITWIHSETTWTKPFGPYCSKCIWRPQSRSGALV